MPVPDDVLVKRQVLAEPDGALTDRTWAALADGTPLVTAAPSGKGWLILFHVTADTGWSNLPLSGTFVDMLRRIIACNRRRGCNKSNLRRCHTKCSHHSTQLQRQFSGHRPHVSMGFVQHNPA